MSKYTLLDFLNNNNGSVNLFTGTSLSVNISMLALCEILSKDSFKKNERVYAIFRGKDPNKDGLTSRKFFAMFRKMLSNEDVAQRRIRVISGDSVEDINIGGDVRVDSVVTAFNVSNNSYKKYTKCINSAVNNGCKNIFVFSDDFLFCGIMEFAYSIAEFHGVNMWVQSISASSQQLFIILDKRHYSDLSRFYIVESKSVGMDKSGSKYIVSVNLLNSELDVLIGGARLEL